MASKGLSRLILYKSDASPPSFAVMVLGDLLGLRFEYREPDMLKKEHKTPEFKKINPMGTIPVLRDGDFIVSESHAIMKYLINKYGGEQKEKLYPSEPQAQAIVDQCLYYDAGVLFVRLKVVVLLMMLHGLPGPTPEHKLDINEGYSVVETYLKDNQYVAGKSFTIADLSLGSTVAALHAIENLNERTFPRTMDWLTRLQEKLFQK